MIKHDNQGPRLATQVLSFALVALVAVAAAGRQFELMIAIIASATLAAIGLQRLFPASRLLWIAFVNLIAVYASVFALFVDELFSAVDRAALAIGFMLPVLAFVAGCWWRREDIKAAARSELQIRQPTFRSAIWLLPVLLVGATVVAASRLQADLGDGQILFLVAMAVIALIVAGLARDVAVFLVDTGLVFDEFFQRITALVLPAFAFLTFYSLLLIVFAALFCLTSQIALEPQFRVDGVPRALSFPEALHFSAATISTVGYGDIVPLTSLARVLAAIEVVLGVMLFLFGVSEILEYSREQRAKHRKGGGPP